MFSRLSPYGPEGPPGGRAGGTCWNKMFNGGRSFLLPCQHLVRGFPTLCNWHCEFRTAVPPCVCLWGGCAQNNHTKQTQHPTCAHSSIMRHTAARHAWPTGAVDNLATEKEHITPAHPPVAPSHIYTDSATMMSSCPHLRNAKIYAKSLKKINELHYQ